MTYEHLSEELFKPRFDFLETSVISNSGCPLPKLSRFDLASCFERISNILVLAIAFMY